jgi:PAS domain S-box-containing protein
MMESESELRLLTELIPQHVWTAFPGNKADYRNQRWLDFTGMTSEEVRDRGWMTALHPDDHKHVLNALQEASSQKRNYEVEVRLRRSDGQYRWFLARAIPQLDQDGNVIKWYGTNTDIEDRKQVEEALRLSEDKFSKAFRSSPDAFAISRQADGMILEVNERWEEILGYARDEAVGRTVWELQIYLNPGERERLISLVKERGSVRDFEVDIRKKSGEIRNVLVSAEPIMIRDEPCLILILRDITERKRTGEALHESEERLRLALEAGRMGVWEWDTRTDALKWSKEHYTIMGLAPFGVEPDYHAWANRVYPDDLPSAMGAMRNAVEEKREYRCEYRIIWPDGSVRWVEGRGKPVYDEDGQCLKVSGLILDITERKQAEEALRESEEALRKSYARIEDLAGRLIAAQEDERRHIARELHDDLNQQVAALAIGISRLKRQFPDAGPAVQEQFAKLREKTDWLSERIRQVSHELHSSILQHVGLSAALNSYCSEFSDREGITVTLDIRDGVEIVSPDAALCLYRVAQESLHNIARHSGARSAVVALTRVNGAIELRVADQGVGFDPGQAREGRGLGLVSMEERVKLLHGSFVLTTRPGAGTELRAQIPLRGEHEQNQGLAG